MDQDDPFPEDFVCPTTNLCLHSTPVCRSACADIKLIGQTLVCPIMREENPIYIWYQEAEQDLKGIYKAHECFSAFGGIFVYTGAFQNF